MTGYDQRQERLLATAARTFAERGYDATSMRDLARAAGMSLAGLYYYVRGKEDLLYRIQRGCFERVLAGARVAVAAEADPAARLAAFVRHHVTFFTTHMAEMKVLAHEAESLTGAMREEVRQLKRAYLDECIALLAALDEPLEAEQRQLCAYALFGMMNWIYTWYRPDGAVSPERLAETITRMCLDGVRGLAPAAARQA